MVNRDFVTILLLIKNYIHELAPERNCTAFMLSCLYLVCHRGGVISAMMYGFGFGSAAVSLCKIMTVNHVRLALLVCFTIKQLKGTGDVIAGEYL